jgi:hypothetical protein
MAAVPRYVPNLQLPARTYLPGSTADRVEVPATLDALPDDWRQCESYLYGIDLWNHGFPWEAHEAWEGPWRSTAAGPRRQLLQALIQCAAARVQRAAGKEAGATTLFGRGLERLATITEPSCMGIAIAELRAGLLACSERRGAAPAIVLAMG